LVKNGETGYIAPLNDETELAKGIYKILCQTADARETMRNNCIEIADSLWHPKIYIDNWLKILSVK